MCVCIPLDPFFLLNKNLTRLALDFLQRIVAFLEQREAGVEGNRFEGYAYCVGLFLSLFLDSILGGQVSSRAVLLPSTDLIAR